MPTIGFDEVEANVEGIYFTDWLIGAQGYNYQEPSISYKDGGVILFTSGSTGKAKGSLVGRVIC